MRRIWRWLWQSSGQMQVLNKGDELKCDWGQGSDLTHGVFIGEQIQVLFQMLQLGSKKLVIAEKKTVCLFANI